MTFLSISRAGLSAITRCIGGTVAAGALHADPHSASVPLADQHAPAGVMFDHMHKAGGFMVGYRYGGSFADGDVMHGTGFADDDAIAASGCSPHVCSMKPSEMTMNMHMLDIMYAPTDWMTLMVMPMWMSHEMTMGLLQTTGGGGHDEVHGGGAHSGHGGAHAGPHSHGVEGWGDTIFGPELKIADGPGYHLQFSPMVSAPTGRVDYKTAGVFTHYGMQLGSGTWDFWPSIIYTGRADRLAWGAQGYQLEREGTIWANASMAF